MTFADIEIAWPWLAVLLPLPWLVRYLLPATRSTAGALRLPDPAFFPAASPRAAGASPLAMVLAGFCWLLLVAAAMRPQVLGDELNAPATGRNLMLAVDLSGSMDVNDFSYQGRRANRLQVTKVVAGEFIDRRAGDRLGLILFGERAYLQVPLTFRSQDGALTAAGIRGTPGRRKNGDRRCNRSCGKTPSCCRGRRRQQGAGVADRWRQHGR